MKPTLTLPWLRVRKVAIHAGYFYFYSGLVLLGENFYIKFEVTSKQTQEDGTN